MVGDFDPWELAKQQQAQQQEPWEAAQQNAPRPPNPAPILQHLVNSPGMSEAQTPLEAFYAGLQVSDTGLAVHGRPDLSLPQNASFMQKLAAGFGQAVGDLPATVATAAATRSPAAAFAAPEAIRQTLLDYYDRGEIHTWGDFAHMMANSAWQVGKAAIVGKVSGVAGRAGESVAGRFTANGFAQSAANVGGFVLGATTAQATLEGRMPDADDFAVGAVNAIGFHAFAGGAGRLTAAGKAVSENLKKTYRTTGIPPWEASQMAKSNPVIADELTSVDVNGDPVTPTLNSMRPPEPEPFYKDPDALAPPEHADKMYRILSDIGHEELNPGLARQYGFDPAVQDEANTRQVLTDLSDRFHGDDEAVTIAMKDGPLVAQKYLASGRNPDNLPEPTQSLLLHMADNYGIKGAWRTVDWTKYPTLKDTVLMKASDGTFKPRPDIIAGYLQDFGRRAGFRFIVEPNRLDKGFHKGDVPPENEGSQIGPRYISADVWQSQTQSGRVTREWETPGRRVMIPNEPEDLWRRWYGLGRYEILYHETGHAIDATVLHAGDATKVTSNAELDTHEGLRDEMTATSKKFRPQLWQDAPGHNSKPSELMADNIAVWLHRPDLRAEMPIFGKLYGKQLDPYRKIAEKYLPTLNGAGGDTGGKWEPPPGGHPDNDEGTIGAGKVPPGDGGKPPALPPKSGVPGFPNSPDWDKQSWTEFFSRFANKVGEQPIKKKPLRTGLEFELDEAKRLDERMIRAGVLKPDAITTEDMLRVTYGSRNRSDYILRYGPIDALSWKPTGAPGAAEIARDIDNADVSSIPEEHRFTNRQMFNTYMMAERSVAKAARGIDTGLFAPGEAEAKVRILRKIFGPMRDKLQQLNNGVLQYMVDSGRLSQDQMNRFISADGWAYMSIRRIMGDDAPFEYGQGKGKFFRAANLYRQMEGSERDIIDPWLATMDNIRLAVQEADRNRAKGHLVNMMGAREGFGLKRLGSAGATMAEPGSDVFKPYRMSEDEKEVARVAFSQRHGSLGANQFIYYNDGKPEVWEAKDEGIARMIRGADTPGEAHMLGKIASFPAMLQRAGIISDPGFVFGIPIKHQISAWISGQGHPPPYIGMVKGLFHIMKADDVYKDALAHGVMTGALTDVDKLFKADVQNTFEKTGVFDRTKNVVRHPIQFAQLMTETLTNASRISDYQRGVNKGEDPLKSAMRSRKNYLDYSEQMVNAGVQRWSRYIPFFRAGLLGLKQGYDAVKERPAQTMMYLLAGMMLPQVMLYAANRAQDQFLDDKDKYINQPRQDRDLYFLSPVLGPNGYRIRLPKPFVWGPAIGVPLERMMDYMYEKNPHAFDGMLKEMGNDLFPSVIPSVARPIAEQMFNYNIYTGQPLQSDRLKAASPEMRYTEATSEPAKIIANALGSHKELNPVTGASEDKGPGIVHLSPIVVDNYMRDWTGSMGMAILNALGAPAKSASPDDWVSSPFVHSFFLRHPAMNADAINEFYADSIPFEQQHQDKILDKSRGNYEQEKADATGQRVRFIQKTKQTLNQIREAIVLVNHNDKMSVDEKRQQTDQMVNEAIQYAHLGSDVLRGKPYDVMSALGLSRSIGDSLRKAHE